MVREAIIHTGRRLEQGKDLKAWLMATIAYYFCDCINVRDANRLQDVATA